MSAAGTAVVEAAGLGRYYDGGWAVRPLNLRLEGGEALALLGPNGAGKSTLIRMLATLLPPTTGTLRIMGHDALARPLAVRAALGVVAQASYLYPRLSCAENLTLYARLYGLPGVEQRVAEALAVVGLGGAAGRPLLELSRGMQQRLALARATLHAPALLLLDEPDGGLDAAARRELAALIDRGRARGQAVVLATHDLQLARGLCERALILVGGRQAYAGPLDLAAAAWPPRYDRASGGEQL